jgi:hypothetical protein
LNLVNLMQAQDGQDYVMVSYRGDITADVISRVLQYIEARFTDKMAPPSVRRKIVSVLVETLQNIFHHAPSAEKDNTGISQIGQAFANGQHNQTDHKVHNTRYGETNGQEEHRPNTTTPSKIASESELRGTLHPEEVPDSTVMVCRKDKGYLVLTGNRIRTEQALILKERIDRINAMSRDELTSSYRTILSTRQKSSATGSGVGIIDIARRSGHKIEVSLREVDEEYQFFQMQIKIAS